MDSKSPRFKLDEVDWDKIGKGFVIAFAGAVIPALVAFSDSINQSTVAGGLLAAIAAGVVNALRIWVRDNSLPPTEDDHNEDA